MGNNGEIFFGKLSLAQLTCQGAKDIAQIFPSDASPDRLVDTALVLLDAASQVRQNRYSGGDSPQGCVPHSDKARRWELHGHACAIEDMTFWIEKNENQSWTATEVETGVSGASAATARQAMDNYWNREYSGT